MNRIYRLVFSAHLGDVVAAGENARRSSSSRTRDSGACIFECLSMRGLFAMLGGLFLALILFALLSHWLAAAGVTLAMSAAVEERRALIGKIEGTYATDSAPTGAANALIVRNLDWTPLSPGYAARDNVALPYLGRLSSKTAIKRGMIEFDAELTGAAAAGTPPPYGALLRACGLSETIVASTSVTYAPISAAFESVSLYANIDGLQQKLLGTRGSCALRFRNEEIPLVHFRLLALYAVPTDTALPTLTLTPYQAPVPVNKTTLR
jgi:hypothetical protein